MNLLMCWRRCATRARWWPSRQVGRAEVDLRRRAAGRGRGAAVYVLPACCARSARYWRDTAMWRSCSSPPHLPCLLAADKLEAANAERPGFFAATKKVL